MTRGVLILVFAAAGLLGIDAWSLWFMDRNPAAREFIASPAFTAALFIGFLVAFFVCVIVVTALILYPEPSSGRSEPEDHV